MKILAIALLIILVIVFLLKLKHFLLKKKYPDYFFYEEENFITDEECEYIIKVATPLLKRSGTNRRDTSEAKADTSLLRQSSTAFLKNDKTILNIKKRIAEFTNTKIEAQEPLQVTHYEEGGFYATHFDSTANESNPRLFTVLLYLNDNYKGGKTKFPRLGKHLIPKKRKLVAFKNLTDDNQIHPLSLHQGDMVKNGEKYICNQWIRLK